MTWQSLILAHTLLSALVIFVRRDVARAPSAAQSPLLVTAIGSVVAAVIGAVAALSLGGVDSKLFMEHALRFIAGGALFTLAAVCMYMTYVYVESVLASMLSTLSVFTTIGLAWVTLHERLTLVQLGGCGLVMAAIFSLLYATRRHAKRHQDTDWLKGCLFAVAAALVYAAAFTNEKYLVTETGMPTYLLFGWGFQAVAAVTVVLLWTQDFGVLRSPRLLRKAAFLGVLGRAAGGLFIAALSAGGNVGLLTLVSNCRVVVVALLAGVVLGERQDYWRRVAAAGVMALGLAMVVWH